MQARSMERDQSQSGMLLILLGYYMRNAISIIVPFDESKLVAPGTGLLNVKNPFGGDDV